MLLSLATAEFPPVALVGKQYLTTLQKMFLQENISEYVTQGSGTLDENVLEGFR